MGKILILYFSKTGNTKEMAQSVANGIDEAKHEVLIKDITESEPEIMLEYEGIIVGSPTYYGTVCAEIKEFFDKSVKFHGKLEGKVGAAFTSAGSRGGDESTVLNLLQIFLVHGMIIQGSPSGNHYGVLAEKSPGDREKEECRKWGQKTAQLVQRLNQDDKSLGS